MSKCSVMVRGVSEGAGLGCAVQTGCEVRVRRPNRMRDWVSAIWPRCAGARRVRWIGAAIGCLHTLSAPGFGRFGARGRVYGRMPTF